MTKTFRPGPRVLLLLLAGAIPLSVGAAVPEPPSNSIEQFLAQDDEQRPYRATRHLEAENGDRKGWLDAVTEFSPKTGFSYQVTAEGGSSYMRTNVLRAVLDGERDMIARGETTRAALAPSNYTFMDSGVDAEGLANIRLSPRRKERLLVAGTMFLRPAGGELVRLEGRLAKSPSFWVKHVNIVRSYDRIAGVVVPVAMESTAELRMFGDASLRMTYAYSEIDGRAVAPTQVAGNRAPRAN